MLTGNLVRVAVAKQRVIPRYLSRDSQQWLEVAESLLMIFREGVGLTRGEIQEEIDELIGEGVATFAPRGLAKVLEDRAEFEVVADVPPETVREHVQRLGRILRKSGDKEALLYEVVSRGTVEEFTSNRRRQHSAYGGD